ncbi:MAG TPA: hypothetical protein PKI93_02595, partial [Alphaproteobacteria bacterium]|nr:hypothetical protein [Alphaproteobacteria bacterium]
MSEMFMNDPTLWVLVSFVIFTLLAIVFGRGILFGMLDGKIAKIRDQIQTAERLKAEAEAMLAQYQTSLSNASAEAEAIIAKAKHQADDYRVQAETAFNETMARRETMLQNRIEQMERAAVDDIRRYAAELAVSATTELISQKLSVADAQRLSDQSIEQITEKL